MIVAMFITLPRFACGEAWASPQQFTALLDQLLC